MQNEELIFQYSDPVEFLKSVLEKKKARNSRFSLRAWARQLGYENPSFISHILNGHRKLNFELVEKISSNLNLNEKSKKYFELLVLMKNCRSESESKIYSVVLESLRGHVPPEDSQILDVDIFQLISEWHHSALLQIVKLRDFQNDLEYITSRLGNGLSAQTVSESLDRLIRLGLLEISPEDGKLRRTQEKAVSVESSVPSGAIRSFHKQMLAKAKNAIEDQAIDERDLRSTTVTIEAEKYPQFLEIIRRAHLEILKLSADGTGDEVYQMNTQFFRITEKRRSL